MKLKGFQDQTSKFPLRLFRPKYFSCGIGFEKRKRIIFLGNNPLTNRVHKYMAANDKFPIYNNCYGSYKSLGVDANGQKILDDKGKDYFFEKAHCCEVIQKNSQFMSFFPVIVLEDTYYDAKEKAYKEIFNELQLIPLHSSQLESINISLKEENEKRKYRNQKSNEKFVEYGMTDVVFSVSRKEEKDRASGGAFSIIEEVGNIDDKINEITFNRKYLTRILEEASKTDENENELWRMFYAGPTADPKDDNFEINTHDDVRSISILTLKNLAFNGSTIFPNEPDRIEEYMSNPDFLRHLEDQEKKYGNSEKNQQANQKDQRTTQAVQNFQPQRQQNQQPVYKQPEQVTSQRAVVSQPARQQPQQQRPQPSRPSPQGQFQRGNSFPPPSQTEFSDHQPDSDDDIPF